MTFFRVLLTSILALLLGRLGRVSANNELRFSKYISANTSQDSFYDPPAGFESAAPGTIFKRRPVPKPIAVSDVLIPFESAWQILYRTQDSLGRPDATVMTIIKPKNAKPGHLFSESYFTNSAWSECSPSKALQIDSRKDNLFVQVQNLISMTALTQGWYVSIADDMGIKGAYTSGHQYAYSTLDSIRAALNSSDFTGLSPNPLITLNGYSGGGIAVGWATELHPHYAPELKIVGAALGGLTPNLTRLAEIADTLDITQHAVSSLNGLANGYPNLTQWLNENLKEQKKEKFWMSSKQCVLGNSIYYGEDFGAYFKRGIDSYLYDPVPHSVRKYAGTMGLVGTPTIPWYLYMTASDNISPVGLTDDLYNKHCANGAAIEYERNSANLTKTMSHLEEGFIGYKNAFKWLKEVHEGKIPAKGCKRTDVYIPTFLLVAFDLVSLVPFEFLGGLIPLLFKLLSP